MNQIFPSLIAGNLLNIDSDITSLEPDSAGFHIDIMDYSFVPNLSWGPIFVNAIRSATRKKLELHMMVDYPEKYIDSVKLENNDIFTIHVESKSSLTITQLLNTINRNNWVPSLALSPHTPLEALFAIGAHFRRILLVSVSPGFSGQKFLPHMKQKLKALNQFRMSHGLDFTIAIDGGITPDLSKELIDLGANELIVGNALFKDKDPVRTLSKFLK